MFKCLIVGAGRITSALDDPGDVHILTHAHAIQEHPSFQLHGFFDANFEQARIAAAKWGGQAFKTVADSGPVDVVVIASPDNLHLQSVLDVLPLAPKVIVLEKPLARTLADAKRLLEIGKDMPILVNFSRRFVPQLQKLAFRIGKGEFGAFLTGTGYYGKGFIHNGSHMLDLVRLLVGEPQGVSMFYGEDDFYPDDPTQTVRLNLPSGKSFFMLGVSCTAFTIFEADLIFEKGRIRMLDSGHTLEIYGIDDSIYYAGYRVPGLVETIETEIDFSMKYVYENVDRFLTCGEPLLSTVQSAFEDLVYV